MMVSSTPARRARWIGVASALTTYVIAVLVFAAVALPIAWLTTDNTSTGFGSLNIGGPGIEIDATGSTPVSSYVTAGSDRVAARNRAAFEEVYGTAATDETPDRRVFLREADPTTRAWAVAIVTIGLAYGALIAFVLGLRRLLLKARAGAPFDVDVARGLRVMGAAVALGPVLFGVGSKVLAETLIADRGGHGSVHLDLHLSVAIWAVLLLALAEVWRYGIDLQRDVEATV